LQVTPFRIERASTSHYHQRQDLHLGLRTYQVKPTSRTKCPSLRSRVPPPAQCTMYASRMMARITTTNQKKNTTMPGIAYPATLLALATGANYPSPPDLFHAA
jgi:hypothetical protein